MQLIRFRMSFWAMLRGWGGMLALRADARHHRAASAYLPYLERQLRARWPKQAD